RSALACPPGGWLLRSGEGRRQAHDPLSDTQRARMEIQLNEEQLLLRENVRRFADEVVRPRAKEIDRTGEFPRRFFDQAGELGLAGVAVPEEHGGGGMGNLSYRLVIGESRRARA